MKSKKGEKGRLFSKLDLLRILGVCLRGVFILLVFMFLYALYELLPYFQSFYQDMKNKATYQIGLDIATSLSIIISAGIFAFSSFSANKRMERQRILEERTSMRVQKMFEVNSKIGDSIVKIILALHQPPGTQTDQKIASLLNETSLLLDTFLFNLGAIGTEEQFNVLIEAKNALKNAVTKQGGGTNVDLGKLRKCLLDLQKAIMTDARKLLTAEDWLTSEKTISGLLKKVYGD